MAFAALRKRHTGKVTDARRYIYKRECCLIVGKCIDWPLATGGNECHLSICVEMRMLTVFTNALLNH